MRALSLRARLVLGVIALGAVALAVANVATYTALRSFLFDRTDAALVETGAALVDPRFASDCDTRSGGPPPGTTAGDYVAVRAADGSTVCTVQVTSFEEDEPPSPPNLEDVGGKTWATVDAHDGSLRYRVYIAADSFDDDGFDDTSLGGFTVVVARSLTDVDATLRRLVLIMLLVTGAALAALAALGLWVVRLGLRPLAAIGATAADIAAGDLSRRVARAEPRTEVGRLGLALNAMLARIEESFAAQQASERRLRRFVADASHELRTPLAAVRAYAELFGRGAAARPDDLERAMTGIERESERMSLLVEDLLLLARLDEGRPLERERVALDEVVGEAVETARALDPEREVTLTADAVTVTGDRDRLRQVVDNLLSNVRSHTPPGTPAHVRVGRNGTSALIEVSDDGPGLTPEQSQRVFERFYRADDSRARATGGVGLGLAIVAAVARAHGGDARVESAPGTGTRFVVALPVD